MNKNKKEIRDLKSELELTNGRLDHYRTLFYKLDDLFISLLELEPGLEKYRNEWEWDSNKINAALEYKHGKEAYETYTAKK